MSEKPYKPSRRKVERAHKSGKTYKCQLITSAFVIFALFQGALFFGGHLPWVGYKILLEYGVELEMVRLHQAGTEAWYYLLNFVGGCLILSCLLCVFGALLQGVRISPEAVMPKAARLNPIGGIQRVLRSAVTGILPLFTKLLFLSLVLASVLLPEIRSLAAVAGSPADLLRVWHSAASWIVNCGAAGLLVLGLGEYMVRKRRFYRELGMSHEEMRRELREDEGDPALKAQRMAWFQALLFSGVPRRLRGTQVVIVKRAKGIN